MSVRYEYALRIRTFDIHVYQINPKQSKVFEVRCSLREIGRIFLFKYEILSF